MSEQAQFNPLVVKLNTHIHVGEDAEKALVDMQGPPKRHPRGAEIVTEGHEIEKIFALHSGWVYRSASLSSGDRQILDFGMPGEAVGLQAYLFQHSLHTVTALTEVETAVIDPDKLDSFMHNFPRIGAALFWACGNYDGILAENLVSIGQRSAYERVAHMLCELWYRLNVLGQTDDGGFTAPLTQAHLAEALGMSTVHVNRVINRLRREELVEMKRGASGIRLLDQERLEDIADFDPHFLHFRGVRYELDLR